VLNSRYEVGDEVVVMDAVGGNVFRCCVSSLEVT